LYDKPPYYTTDVDSVNLSNKFKFNNDQQIINALPVAYHTGKLLVNRPILSGRNSGNLRTSYDVGDYVVVAFNANKNPVHYIRYLMEAQSQKAVDGDDEEISAAALPVGTD
jgi:hypothetical protein